MEIIRVIIYEGDEDWVKRTIKKSLGDGKNRMGKDRNITLKTIKSKDTLINQMGELLIILGE